MYNTNRLSDQAIVSGILIGATSESQAAMAIYDQFAYTLQNFIDINQTPIDTAIVWQTVECFIHGIKNGHISLKEKDIETYLKEIASMLKKQDPTGNEELNAIYDDKLVWDYYLNLLSSVEHKDIRLLTRSFGEGIEINDLSERLVAKGVYANKDDVKTQKYEQIRQISGLL